MNTKALCLWHRAFVVFTKKFHSGIVSLSAVTRLITSELWEEGQENREAIFLPVEPDGYARYSKKMKVTKKFDKAPASLKLRRGKARWYRVFSKENRPWNAINMIVIQGRFFLFTYFYCSCIEHSTDLYILFFAIP